VLPVRLRADAPNAQNEVLNNEGNVYFLSARSLWKLCAFKVFGICPLTGVPKAGFRGGMSVAVSSLLCIATAVYLADLFLPAAAQRLRLSADIGFSWSSRVGSVVEHHLKNFSRAAKAIGFLSPAYFHQLRGTRCSLLNIDKGYTFWALSTRSAQS
jgi:hypothetical protein